MTSGERVVGYVRVSKAEQEANGGGLDAQRAAIEAECARRGWVLTVIESDALSGRSTKRPGLERALGACRSAAVAGIVVAKLDRLSRSMLDFARIVDEAKRKGFNIVALDQGFDLQTPNGRAMAGMLAVFAEWEREMIGERTRRGMEAKRLAGTLKGKPGRTSVVPAEVRSRIRRWRSSGKSLGWIAGRLNELGVATGQGGVRWYPSTVRAVLRAKG